MFNFDMKTTQNFASFIDEASGVAVFVDSFDNEEFEVRLGDITHSYFIGKFIATDDMVLNTNLKKLVESNFFHHVSYEVEEGHFSYCKYNFKRLVK